MTRVLVTLVASFTLVALPTVAAAQKREGLSRSYPAHHSSSAYRAYGYSRDIVVAPGFSRGATFSSRLPHSPGSPENRGGGVDHW